MIDSELRVLAVDDDRMMRRALAAMMKASGVAIVHEAADGNEALEILLTLPIDFIVSDHDMPEMGGLDLLHSLESAAVFAMVPVLMVSADGEDTGAEADEYGADGFLSKPFTHDMIEERIQGILEKRASLLPLDISLSRAFALCEFGADEDAIMELEEIRRHRPDSPRLWAGAGEVYLQMGDLDAAKDCYEEAMDIDDRFVKAYDQLGVILIKEGNIKEALRTIRLATRISPRNRDRHQFLGKVLLDQGDEKGARAAFFQSVAGNTDAVSQKAAVAELFLISDRPDLAETEFTAAIEAEPGNVHCYNRLGIVFRRQKKFVEAIKNYRNALKLAPDDSVLYYNLALVLIENGDREGGITHLRKALSLDPSFEKAKAALERVSEWKQKTGKGRKSSAGGNGSGHENGVVKKGAGSRNNRRAPRHQVPVVILASSLSRSPLMLEDVSETGFRVMVFRKPQSGTEHVLAIQAADSIIGRCRGKVAWLRENATQPVTWSVGLDLQMPEAKRKDFVAALEKVIAKQGGGA